MSSGAIDSMLADDEIHLHLLVEAHVLGLGVEGDRQRADEGRQQHLGIGRDLRQVGHEVLGIERHRDAAEHLAARLLDVVLGFLVGALAPGIVGIDDRPFLAEVFDAPRHAGGRDRIGVGAGAEREARAFRAGRLGRLAGREVDRLELGRDRDRGEHHAGMHRADDELGIAALDQVAQLARAAGRIGFGVFGRQLDLAAGDAAALVDDVDRGLGGLVVPEDPRTRSRRSGRSGDRSRSGPRPARRRPS